MSPGTSVVEKSLNNIDIMVSKRAGLKDTIESITRDMVEHVKIKFPIYADTQLFVEKGMKITWK